MMPLKNTLKPLRLRGFSLLELSIVIAIISVVAVMGLEGVASYVAYTAYQSTEERMKTIDRALLKYRYVHGRLPCPATLNIPITDTNYGREQGGCLGATALSGGVSSIAIPVGSGGAGYAARGFLVPFSGGSGYGATGIAQYDTTGVLTSIAVPMRGYGYTAPPMLDLTANSTSTTAATATATISSNRVDSPITPTTGGSGYASTDTSAFPVGITGGGSTSGAIAMAHITGGVITDIVVTDPGYGFTAAPTVTVDLDFASTHPITTPATPGTIGRTVFAGGLPVRELGLPLSYALDAYGSKFIYYVTGDLTNAATFKNAIGNIQIRTGPLAEPCVDACTISSPNAAYAFLSVGRDQRGGYNQRGNIITNCIPDTGFDEAIDAQNCVYETSATPATLPTTPTATPIPAGVLYNSPFNNGGVETNYTDDLLIYHIKSEL